jgi:hypothetical protein
MFDMGLGEGEVSLAQNLAQMLVDDTVFGEAAVGGKMGIGEAADPAVEGADARRHVVHDEAQVALAPGQGMQAVLQGAAGMRFLVAPALLLAHHRRSDRGEDHQHQNIGQGEDEGRRQPGRGQQSEMLGQAHADHGCDGRRADQHDDARPERHGADDDRGIGEEDARAQAGDQGASYRDPQQDAPEQRLVGGDRPATPDQSQGEERDRDEECRADQPVVVEAPQFRQQDHIDQRADQGHGGGQKHYLRTPGQIEPFLGGAACSASGFRVQGQYNFASIIVLVQCRASSAVSIHPSTPPSPCRRSMP